MCNCGSNQPPAAAVRQAKPAPAQLPQPPEEEDCDDSPDPEQPENVMRGTRIKHRGRSGDNHNSNWDKAGILIDGVSAAVNAGQLINDVVHK